MGIPRTRLASRDIHQFIASLASSVYSMPRREVSWIFATRPIWNTKAFVEPCLTPNKITLLINLESSLIVAVLGYFIFVKLRSIKKPVGVTTSYMMKRRSLDLRWVSRSELLFTIHWFDGVHIPPRALWNIWKAKAGKTATIGLRTPRWFLWSCRWSVLCTRCF